MILDLECSCGAKLHIQADGDLVDLLQAHEQANAWRFDHLGCAPDPSRYVGAPIQPMPTPDPVKGWEIT